MNPEPSAPSPLVLAAFDGKVFALGRDDGKRVWSFESKHDRIVRLVPHGELVFVLGERLACLEYRTGRVLWQVDVPNRLESAKLIVEGDRIFVAEGGDLAAFDVMHGKLLWYEQFPGEGNGATALATQAAVVQAYRD